jgi:hypothetical protein
MPIHGHYSPKAVLGPCFQHGFTGVDDLLFPLFPFASAAEGGGGKGKKELVETAFDLPGVNARA